MKKGKKEIETKAVQLADAIITLSLKGYNHLNKRFADLTKITVEQALIELNNFFKNQL